MVMLRNTLSSSNGSKIIVGLATAVVLGFTPTLTMGQVAPSSRVDVTSIANSKNQTAAEKAEALALAGELLNTPTSFMHADPVFKAALFIDPSNARAQLWAAALGPAMELKGLIARIEPLAQTHPARYSHYQAEVARLKKMYAGTDLLKFMLSGPADIESEVELQEVIARVSLKIDDFRRTVIALKNRSQPLQLHFHKELFKPKQIAAYKNNVHYAGRGVYELDPSLENSDMIVRNLNRADLEVLQQAAAGIEIYMTIANSRKLTGAYQRYTKPKKRDIKKLLMSLEAEPDFGTLREQNGLGAIPDLAKDFVLGIRYAISYNNSLCPNGYETPRNRPGYLFENGICVANPDGVERVLHTIDVALTGSPIAVNLQAGNNIPTTMTPLALFKTPVQDIRSIGRIDFDSCGNVTHVDDYQGGGVFPNGDLNQILENNANQNCQWPASTMR